MAEFEQRIRELNILGRLAEGINFTSNFDDFLALVYAQFNQVIPTVDFYIVLKDQRRNYFHYAFYLEEMVNNLLIVPMRLGDETVAAIEVIGKGDHLPFTIAELIENYMQASISNMFYELPWNGV